MSYPVVNFHHLFFKFFLHNAMFYNIFYWACDANCLEMVV
jgi:hypothetical protein